jgi:ATP-dependent DNA helicase DinG
VTAPSVRDVLGPHGWLARIDPTWEARPGQLAMAEQVATRLAKGGVSAIEAPTGIGKTLAYLVPALLSGKRVVVSTHTKTLQDQIVSKDLPRLERAFAAHGRQLVRADSERVLDRALRYAPMKGRSNYLCLDRLDKKRRQGRLAFVRDGALWDRLAEWARTTTRGDRAELAELPEDGSGFGEVDARAETCLGSRCPAYEQCFVVRMRREAAEADLIVVNHHLLLADLALRAEAALAGEGRSFGAVIPNADALVVDEAHALEEIASDHFGGDVSSHKLTRWLRDAMQWLADRRAEVEPYVEDKVLEAVARTEAVFATIPVGAGRLRLPSKDPALDKLAPLAGRADVALEAVSAALEGYRADATAEGLGRRARDLAASLRFVVEAAGDDYVYWAERAKEGTARLGAAPIEVATVLADTLFPTFGSVVMTSATLAVEGSAPFAYFLERVGAPSTTETLRLDTPFRFEEQAAIYVPQDLPGPEDGSYAEASVARARQLIELMGGGAFFLFTSHRAMQEAARVLRPTLPFPLLVQGEAPKMRLVEAFVARAPAVLLATASFWEGVDVPGDPLRLVVIDRLPFASPADPVVAARIARIGETAFESYQLPQAILKLRQGFGRLVRRETDHGVVAILDGRVHTRGYGRRFLAALPPATRVHDLEALRAWHQRRSRLPVRGDVSIVDLGRRPGG